MSATALRPARPVVWKRDRGDTVIGAFASAYVNAGNLGLPIASYVLGDASLIGPTLLTQLLILQPLGLAVLDMPCRRAGSPSGRQSPGSAAVRTR